MSEILSGLIKRAKAWEAADHYEDCPAYGDCPHGDDYTCCSEDECSDKQWDVCDCYLGVMNAMREQCELIEKELIPAAHALLIPFDGAMWSGPPATLVSALDRLREAVAKAEA